MKVKLLSFIAVMLIFSLFIVSVAFVHMTNASYYRLESAKTNASISNLDLNFKVSEIGLEGIEITDLIANNNSGYKISLENDTGLNVSYQIWYDCGNYNSTIDPSLDPSLDLYPWPSYSYIVIGGTQSLMSTENSLMYNSTLQPGNSTEIDVSFDLTEVDNMIGIIDSSLESDVELFAKYLTQLELERDIDVSLRIYAYTV